MEVGDADDAVSSSSSSLKPLSLGTLPPELLDHVLSFLDAFSLSRAGCVCRLLHAVARSERLWERLCRRFRVGIGVRCRRAGAAPPPESWHAFFRSHAAWRAGLCRRHTLARHHEARMNGVVAFDAPTGRLAFVRVLSIVVVAVDGRYGGALAPEGGPGGGGGDTCARPPGGAPAAVGVLLLRGHRLDISSLMFVPDSAVLVSASIEPELMSWDLSPPHDPSADARGPCPAVWPLEQAHRLPVSCMAYSRSLRHVFTASWDGSLAAWRLPGVLVGALDGPCAEQVSCVEVRGDVVAAGSHDCTVRVWKASTRVALRVFRHANIVNVIRFVSDSLLAAGDRGGCVYVWNVRTGGCIRAGCWFAGEVFALAVDEPSLSCFASSQGHVLLLRLERDGGGTATTAADAANASARVFAVGEPNSPLYALRWLRERGVLVAGSYGHTVELVFVDLCRLNVISVTAVPAPGAIYFVAANALGNRIVFASRSGVIGALSFDEEGTRPTDEIDE